MDSEPFKKVTSHGTVDYALRTAQQNMMLLSSMADQKANILIGASFIMLTILVGHIENDGLSLPLAVLGIFTFAAAIFAILVVTPATAHLTHHEHGGGLLFFTNIASMEKDAFKRTMGEVLQNDASIYTAIVEDLYEHACVLSQRKYYFLRISYTLFLTGWVATASLLLGAFLVS